MNLLEAWADWHPSSPPFVLDGDKEVLNSHRSAKAVVTRNWEEASQAPDFCAPGDRNLHLGLIPQPFIGDVRSASIYVLLLNPGLSPSDYYGEYKVPKYREALLANLKQHTRSPAQPFLFLDPEFAWHAGFGYWQGKLGKVMQRLASNRKISFAEARWLVGSSVASIELVPYHSSSFKDAGGWLRTLQSVQLTRKFVAEFVVPRVQRREAIVIVTRKVAEFNLPTDQEGVVLYSSGQARGAHLTPDSPGGRAILKHLGASG